MREGQGEARGSELWAQAGKVEKCILTLGNVLNQTLGGKSQSRYPLVSRREKVLFCFVVLFFWFGVAWFFSNSPGECDTVALPPWDQKKGWFWGPKDLHMDPRSASLSPGTLGRSLKEPLRFCFPHCKVGRRHSPRPPHRAGGAAQQTMFVRNAWNPM